MTAERLQRVLAPCLERLFPGSHAGEARAWGRVLCARARGSGMKLACLARLTPPSRRVKGTVARRFLRYQARISSCSACAFPALACGRFADLRSAN